MTATLEWAAGLVSLPSYVMDGTRAPYRPSVFLCVDAASRFVLCAEVLDPEEALEAARKRFAAVVRSAGARAPSVLRVATAELSRVLRREHPGIEVVVAATPEIDEVFQSFLEHAARTDDGPDSYLGPDVDEAVVARLFAAGAHLHQAQPWAAIPPDACVQVDCPALAIEGGLLVVVGQMGQSFGFAIFPDRAAFDALQLLGETGRGVPPPQIMFSYDSRDELPRPLVDEVRAHRWKLAGPDAYPSVMRLDGEGGARPLRGGELAGAAAVADALATLVRRAPLLDRVWRDAPPISIEATGVVLTAPAPLPRKIAHAPREHVLGDMVRRPLVRDGKVDVAACDVYVELFTAAFERSPEASVVEPHWARVFIEDGAHVLGKTLAELVPDQVRDLVFAALPHSLIAQPDDAPALIATIQAVLEFAARELGSYAANWSATEAMPADAVELLARELGDESNFGPAKAFFMQGVAAGYDMSTQDGVGAWTRAYNLAQKPAGRRSTQKSAVKKSSTKRPRKTSAKRH